MRIDMLALLVAIGLAVPLPAQEAPERGAWVVRLGNDTVVMELYTRDARSLFGHYVSRVPRTTLQRYVATLDAESHIVRFDLSSYRPGPDGETRLQRVVVAFRGDSATVEITRQDSTATRRIAAPRGTTPMLVNSYALLEHLTRYQRRSGEGATSAPILFVGGSQTGTASIEPLGPDTLAVALGQIGPLRAHVDSSGRVLGVTGVGSTLQIVAERVASLEIERLAREFAARDTAGRGLGVLSPPDSFTATVGGAAVTVNYSRPSARGRAVFGNVVPWNQVWRTGANAATHLTTDADLEIGGAAVPAGTYTLWTIPSPTGWKLIVNKRTREWGTQYDEAHDLARVDMRVEALRQPVEQFTISVEPAGEGAVLKLAWERTVASVALKRK